MSSDGIVRVGVIGRGFAGRTTAAAYEATPGCEVVDTVSPRDEAALAALLAREDVDLISVHSPPFMHLEHVRRAIEEGPAGRAVLCDKPMGANSDEAAEMERLASEAGIQSFVNYEFRVHPLRTALREQVVAEPIGPIEHVQWSLHSAVWSPDRPYRWTSDASLGGGWLRAAASHHIDFLRWTFGEITEATAMLRTTVPQRTDADGNLRDVSADDGFAAILRTESGMTIALDATATCGVDAPGRITLVGRDGLMELITDSVHEIGGRVVVQTAEGRRELLRIEPWGDINQHDASAMNPWTVKIVEAVRGDRDPLMPSFADGAACHRVMDMITRSAALAA
jgi:predicted dehydrogenase